MRNDTLTKRVHGRWLSGLLICLLSGWGASEARACDLVSPNPTASFGMTSSLAVASTAQQTSAQPNAGIRCQGSLVGILVTGDRIDATLSSTNGGRLEAPSGDTIEYAISADAAGQEALTPGTTYNYYNSYILGLLGILGGSAADIPMYFRTLPGSAGNVAAGRYTDTLTVNWNWSVCTGIGVLGICLGRERGSGTSLIQLQLEVMPDCAIDAPDLNFGSAPLVSGFAPVTQTLRVRCTKGQAYSVGLSDGQHSATGQRRMEAAGRYLTYELYKGPSGTERWGDQGAERRESLQADSQPGNYDGVTWQGFIYRGVIDTNQPTPPAGLYTDTIVVDVAF